MADLESICVGQRQACALRVTRLAADCTPVLGAGNGVCTAGLITLNADPGSVVFFDKLYVATECVPEPSSILALSGGLIGLLGIARRRRI